LLVDTVELSEVPFRQFGIRIKLHMMDLKSPDGGRQVGGVIANDPQSSFDIKLLQRLLLRSGVGIQIVPQSKSMVGQGLPGKMGAGINFSGGCNIRVANKIGGRDIVFFLKHGQYLKQAVDLRGRKIRIAVIVQLYSNRSGIEVAGVAPFACARVPCTKMIVKHLDNLTIPADYVV